MRNTKVIALLAVLLLGISCSVEISSTTPSENTIESQDMPETAEAESTENVEEKEDGLILNQSDNLKGGNLNSENDHRLFMAFSIAGMYVGNCTVSDPGSVKVSFPNFIEEMNKLGAKILIQ